LALVQIGERHIHDCLVGLGHEVLTAHLLDDDVDAGESRLADRDVFLRDLAWVEAADAIVAEASGSSYGVGFEVGYTLGRAAETGQRVFVLYDASRRGRISRLISGLSDARAQVLPVGEEPRVRGLVHRLHLGAVRRALALPQRVHVLHHRRDRRVVGERGRVLADLLDRRVQLAIHFVVCRGRMVVIRPPSPPRPPAPPQTTRNIVVADR
jgi:hypothetical protein